MREKKGYIGILTKAFVLNVLWPIENTTADPILPHTDISQNVKYDQFIM
jgi:hypothetical protein